MFCAEIKSIEANIDLADHWQKAIARVCPDPDFGCESFTLEIGTHGSEGADIFYLYVATYASVPQAHQEGVYKYLLVDSFDPDRLEKTLHERVAECTGYSWINIVEQLKAFAVWEYDREYDFGSKQSLLKFTV